jgi:toxin ParE1/3/4
MVDIFWTKESELWLKDIYDYIAKNDKSVAKKVVNEIYQKTQILKLFPEIGYLYPNNKNIRILLYGHYRIAYLIKTKQSIDVLGVFHGSLSIERYF